MTTDARRAPKPRALRPRVRMPSAWDRRSFEAQLGAVLTLVLVTTGCATTPSPAPPSTVGASIPDSRAVPPAPAAAQVTTPTPSPTPTTTPTPTPTPTAAPAAAAPRAAPAPVAGAVDTSHPDHVIGDGTPASCTSAAVVDAVAAGGIVTFSCGAAPVTITMAATAKVVNAHGDVTIDGGGLVTLSGGGTRRILYQNTCDQAQGWTSSHCQDQAQPHLTLQHLTFADGNSTGDTAEGGGGGAVFVRGGRFTVVDSTFRDNRCDPTGPDLGGAALRVLSQYNGEPVQVVSSTFTGGRCSNGGAVSSIGVSWEIRGSVMTGNTALGSGANPARSGTPGGGSGGAIYADGNAFTVRVIGSRIEGNHAAEGGGAIFFVSNDRSGSLSIETSTLTNNPSDGFESSPGIFYLGSTKEPTVSGSTIG